MKYLINTESDISKLKDDNTVFVGGDIIVHKPFEFYDIAGLLKKYFGNIEIVPASPGTSVYSINGYNTSVIKSVDIV